jgi:hypothetical protein
VIRQGLERSATLARLPILPTTRWSTGVASTSIV